MKSQDFGGFSDRYEIHNRYLFMLVFKSPQCVLWRGSDAIYPLGKGDAILQKTFCTDFLTKKMKSNEGELPQYYVEQSHPAIIDPDVFDEVQIELKKRKNAGYTSYGSIFSSKIMCGECGAYYGPKVWHSTSKCKRTIWQCNQKFKNDKRCSTPHLYEDEIKAAFVGVMNRKIEDKDAIITDYKVIFDKLVDLRSLDEEGRRLNNEANVLLALIKKDVAGNACKILDQVEYNQRYAESATRYAVIKAEIEDIADQRMERKVKCERLTIFIEMMESNELLIDFDENLWKATVESVTICSKDKVTFAFKCEGIIE